MNRRDFVKRVPGGLLAGGLGLSATGCLGFHYVTSTVAGRRLLVSRAELGEAPFALVEAPGSRLPLYLYRLAGDEYSAVSTRCMHRGCQVEPAADHLVCPCHGSEYTNTGEILKGPTQRPLRRFPVTVERAVVAIELPPPGEEW